MSYTQVESTNITTVRRRSSAISSNLPPSALLELTELSTEDDNDNHISKSSTKPTKRPQHHFASHTTSYEKLPTTVMEASHSDDSYDSDTATNNKDQTIEHDDDDLEYSSSSSSGYLRVMRDYPMYRAYFLSHVCQNMGDWFVRIASILVVEQQSSSGKTLSHLVLSVLLPRAIFAQVGGILSDKYDRRKCMIVLDVLSGIVVLGYLVAVHYRSLTMIYVVSAIRSSLGATYYPITTGIVPLLVPNVRDLQLANTLNSWAWGMTSVVGGLVAGSITAEIGSSACYIIDFVTFLLSAALMHWGVSGNFKVGVATTTTTTTPSETTITTTTGAPAERKSPCVETYTVFAQLLSYLWACGFGLLVFSKCSASFVWGIEDIVGAEFSTVFDENGIEDEEASSWHMGLLFSMIGSGCMAGPVLVNTITNPQQPYTLQRAILIGLTLLTSGWFAISRVNDNFAAFLVCTFFRTMGSGTVWVNSTVLLQTLCDPQVLGRVLALEYTLTTLLEATSATISGNLADAGYSKNQLALFGAFLGVGVVSFWGIYYSLSLGAAHPRFNNSCNASSHIKAAENKPVDDDFWEFAKDSTARTEIVDF